MDAQTSTAAICCVCKEFLDTLAPHAILKFDYAHIDCADAYDAQMSRFLPDPLDRDPMGSDPMEDQSYDEDDDNDF